MEALRLTYAPLCPLLEGARGRGERVGSTFLFVQDRAGGGVGVVCVCFAQLTERTTFCFVCLKRFFGASCQWQSCHLLVGVQKRC